MRSRGLKKEGMFIKRKKSRNKGVEERQEQQCHSAHPILKQEMKSLKNLMIHLIEVQVKKCPLDSNEMNHEIFQ